LLGIFFKNKKTGALNMRFLNAAAMATCGILSLTAALAPARASTVTYDWSLTGPAASLGGVPLPGSGTITATASNTGSETLTAITGMIGGSAITGLTSFFGSDNLVYPSGTTPIDTSGIAFTDAAGQSINVFSF
jgi:hypothetical protein